MPKFGDVREDGKIYAGSIKTGPRAGYELWTTGDVIARRIKANKDASKKKARDKVVRYNTDEKFRLQLRAKTMELRHADYRSDMLARAKLRAARGGYPCDIERDDIPLVTVCPILGLELKVGKGTIQDQSPTLDKIIPELGYIKGNVIVVSKLANCIKSNATPDQIMAVAKFYKKLLGGLK